MAGFSVNIGANTASLVTGLNNARNTLAQFNNSLAPLNRNINLTNISFAGISNSSRAAVPGINAAGVALSNIRPGANQAAAALTNVGRVAQDLPFGFIGIQNNLNPLLESFQRLRAETGSNRGALSALGQSLIGPAGIGIALSIVSAAFVIFQNGIAGFNSKTKEAKDKTEEFLKTLKSVGVVVAEATGGQAGAIAQVQSLANVVIDTNNAYAERKRALEELQQINKSYFGDLKLEESQMGILTARVNEYTQAIVAQAVLKGFTDEISRVSVELAKQDRVLRNNADEVNRLRTALANTKQSETSLTGEDRISRKYVNLKNALENAEDAFSAQFTVVSKLRSNFDDLQKSIDGAVLETLKFRDLNNPEKQKAEVDLLKKRLEALEKIKAVTKDATQLVGLQEAIFELQVKIAIRDQGKNQLSKQELDALIKGYQDELNEAFKNQALELEAIPKIKFSEVVLADISFKELESKIAKATGLDKKIPVLTLHEARIRILGAKLTGEIEFREGLQKKLQDDLNSIVSNLKVDAITTLADSIGNALVNGDFKNIFKSLFDVVASGLQQFGKALIAYGIAQRAFQIATRGLNPALAIAAGAGLIVAGAALRAALPKFATGGIVTGPVIGQIGEMHRPEVIMPLDRLPQMLRSIGSPGGDDLQMVPIINNEGLYLAMKRGERRAGRKF